MTRGGAWLASVAASVLCGTAMAETWHIDARRGDDAFDGRTPASAWRSLARIAQTPPKPGDAVLLAAGSVWKEPLRFSWSGRPEAPIRIARYGDGAMPRIDTGGGAENAVEIINAEYVTLSGLEVTNRSDGSETMRRGIYVLARDFGIAHGIRIEGNYVHHVGGTNARKDNGGIIAEANGSNQPTAFDSLIISGNIVRHVDRSGIATISDQVSRDRWFPSTRVVIRDNLVDDAGGDGLVVRAAEVPLIEHNIVLRSAARAGGYNAGIWQWSTDNALIQLNESAYTNGLLDGQGFDSDYNSRGTTLLHNFSHDNAGGFLLICSPVTRDENQNIGNTGTIARGNVSYNDHTRIFQLAGASDVQIEGNVIHTSLSNTQMMVATWWDGWSRNVHFSRNVFNARAKVSYGYETARKDGRYTIAPGLGTLEGFSYVGNIYAGRHDAPPPDPAGQYLDTRGSKGDWRPPRWTKPTTDGFPAFMDAHRAWMLAMLTRELGTAPKLETPRPLRADEARSGSPVLPPLPATP